MIDSSNILNQLSIGGINPLIVGGAITLVIAAWNHLKSTFQYLSSFLVITAHVSEYTTNPVRIYLQSHWSRFPGGKESYISQHLQFKNETINRIVPFFFYGKTTIFFHGWRFVILDIADHQITTIRGLVNFQRLISDSLDYDLLLKSRYTERNSSSRFRIIEKKGSNKANLFNDFTKRPERTSNHQLEDSASPISGSSDGLYAGLLNLNEDQSFKYDKSEYIFSSKDNPFSSLYYEQPVIDAITQARQWMDLKDWYMDRNIPWRRGWLMYGPPGTGKSSLCRAIGINLGIPIYRFHLSTMDDLEFIDEWQELNTPCIVLFEDFDTIFNKRENITAHKSLTFDCVLNQISGVTNGSGIFLMITTNHLENIDQAMGIQCDTHGVSTRPGRIDSVIYLGYITLENRRKLANRILRDWPEEIDRMVAIEGDITPIQFQEMCIQVAFTKLNDLSKIQSYGK